MIDTVVKIATIVGAVAAVYLALKECNCKAKAAITPMQSGTTPLRPAVTAGNCWGRK